MSKNANLHRAKENQDDEFYTRYEDVEAELQHYWKHLVGKIIHCPCDGAHSAFYEYLHAHYNAIGLAGLTATSYNKNGAGMLHGTDGTDDWSHPMDDDGSFDSLHALRIMDKADCIITNPPFSRMKDFLRQVVGMGKDFIIICPLTAFEYAAVRHLLRDREIIVGTQKVQAFIRPDGSEYSLGNTTWMTNLEHGIVPEPLDLTAKYDPEIYPRYDNFDAIDVASCKEIPNNYRGVMGVPFTFLEKWNPDQFEIVGAMRQLSPDFTIDGEPVYNRLAVKRWDRPYINGERKFAKLPIRRK